MSDLAATIVGVSPAIAELRAYLPKVARSSATVLITGATGSGKERVAQAIHDLGPRAGQPFVPINCAALPDSLIESELFGHERGAFTGAVSASPGHIVRADRGTLFMDEIGEMSWYAQAKLLRVLESHIVQPIGSSRPRHVDVRVIAATNQALETLVQTGRFRPDLYYRLNVARLTLPPLCDRREDIPLLFRHAVNELNLRERKSVGAPSPDLLACLVAYDWPGNVRELRNLVESLFIDPPDGPISLDQLPPVFREMFSRYRTAPASERDRLLLALEGTNWNKVEAAKQLKWSRMTLYRRLAKYQLHRSA